MSDPNPSQARPPVDGVKPCAEIRPLGIGRESWEFYADMSGRNVRKLAASIEAHGLIARTAASIEAHNRSARTAAKRVADVLAREAARRAAMRKAIRATVADFGNLAAAIEAHNRSARTAAARLSALLADRPRALTMAWQPRVRTRA